MACLVLLRDSKARLLLGLSSDGTEWRFSRDAQPFVLRACGPGGLYSLQHSASGSFLGCASQNGRIRAGVLSPVAVNISFDARRSLAIRLQNGCFLHRSPGGVLVAVKHRLHWQKDAKLLTMLEVALPRRCLIHRWPVPVALQLDRGTYVTAQAGRVAATAEVACCTEQFVVGLPNVLEPAPGALAQAPGCIIYSSDLRHVVTADPGSGQLQLVPQHGCVGREAFVAQLLSGNRITLQQAGGPGQQASVVRSMPSGALASSPASADKPSPLVVEFASGRSVVLLTAHGTLLGAPTPGSAGALAGRPRGVAAGAAAAAGLRRAAWVLTHHGNSIYSVHQACGGQQLYVDSAGVPSVGSDPRIAFPDRRVLFTASLACVAIGQAGAGAAGGFAPPLAGGKARLVQGVTLRTLQRYGGRLMYLSALPDGLITTVEACTTVTRWELFTIVDQQAVVQSPLQPLRWLPSGPTKGDAVSSFPIAVQQRVAGGRLAPPSALRSAPSMPCIAECCDGAHEPLRQAGGEDLAPPALCSRPLRSYSEADLQGMAAAGGRPAQHRLPPRRLALIGAGGGAAEGWGVLSPGSLQDAACRAACAALMQEVGSELPGWRGEELLKRLRASLPDELCTRLEAQLELLCGSPPAAKLSLALATKAEAAGAAPAWALRHLPRPGEEALGAYLCAACCGASGVLLPLEPFLSPLHHAFLDAMDRRRFGGARGRRRTAAAAVGPARGDAVTGALRLLKTVACFYTVARVSATLGGSTERRRAARLDVGTPPAERAPPDGGGSLLWPLLRLAS